MNILPIAKIKNGFNDKFGVPRQSGLCDSVSFIVFEKEYRIKEAFLGLEEYSHIWIIWEFSQSFTNSQDKNSVNLKENKPNKTDSKITWSPTVRPPRLGGNKRVGVFATRSPNRPNSLGLSSVRLLEIIEDDTNGIMLKVEGADLMDGTPIFDIKPYIRYSDSHEDAKSGFAEKFSDYKIKVEVEENLYLLYPEKLINEIVSILENDPKPSYQKDFTRVYGMKYFDFEIKFFYTEKCIRLMDIQKNHNKNQI